MSRRDPWTPVLDSLTTDPEISDGAYRLYVLLASYCWNGNDTCWPGQKTLGTRLGVTDTTVRTRLRELVLNGLVVTVPRSGRSTEYQLQRLVAPPKISSGVGPKDSSDEEHEPLTGKNTQRPFSNDDGEGARERPPLRVVA